MLWDNGMGKMVDYDRINVTLENLHTQLSNTEALHEQQLNMIKYMLGIPNGTTIQLARQCRYPIIGNSSDTS